MAPGAWGAGELELTVSGAPARLIAGDVATLRARVTNRDPTRTGNTVQVNFIPSAGDPFDPDPKLSGTGCQPTFGPAVTCSASGLLPPGGTLDLSLTASLPGLQMVIVDAGARAYVGDPEIGPVVELTSPQVRWQSTVEPKADTKLDFTAAPDTVANGAPATIRAVVTNTTSDGVAYGAAVKFSLPPGLEIVDRPADCAGTALSLTCPVGDLGPQLTATRTLTARSTQEGSYTVLGSVAWARDDPTTVDSQGQVSVTVLPPPDTGTGGGTPPAAKPPSARRPKAVSAATLAQGVPAGGRCVRARRLSLVLRSLGSWDPVRATIRVTGRRRPLVLKGARAQRPFTLTLPRRGGVTLKLAVTLDNGRRYTATRTFRRC